MPQGFLRTRLAQPLCSTNQTASSLTPFLFIAPLLTAFPLLSLSLFVSLVFCCLFFFLSLTLFMFLFSPLRLSSSFQPLPSLCSCIDLYLRLYITLVLDCHRLELSRAWWCTVGIQHCRKQNIWYFSISFSKHSYFFLLYKSEAKISRIRVPAILRFWQHIWLVYVPFTNMEEAGFVAYTAVISCRPPLYTLWFFLLKSYYNLRNILRAGTRHNFSLMNRCD